MTNTKKKPITTLLAVGLLLGACSGADQVEAGVDPGGTDTASHPSIPSENTEMAGTPEPRDDFVADTTMENPVPPREADDRPYDTNFRGYEENEPTDPTDDAESTFAVDVDTGSYTLLRGWLDEGYQPPPEAVRPEEYINFFNLGYETPDDDTFAIHVDGTESPYYDSTLVRIGIAAKDIEAEERPDVNLTLVVDTSGSMEEDNRLELVKESIEYLVGELREEDRIAIVEYSEDARVVLESTPVDDDEEILDAVDSLQPRASTNAAAGLELGYQLTDETYVEDDSNMVVLLSDGVANVGADTPGGILETLAEANENGISLLTVGVGLGNYNDELMEQLANRADGQYRYVDTLDEVERIFGRDLVGSIVTVAKDAKVQVSFDSENVESYRLIGYENRDVADRDFERDDVDAGEIGSGHTVTALYEVEIRDDAVGKLGEVQFRWADPDSGEVTEVNEPIYSDAVSAEWDDASPHLRLAATVGAFAEWIGDREAAEDIDYDDIDDNIDDLETELESSDVSVQRPRPPGGRGVLRSRFLEGSAAWGLGPLDASGVSR
ncbi:MAG: DUF3520 domain-containing protein [Acidimicrobiia bacterium]|nr:DUF3520 domain-containing protein [Acidimicrobiia bacterium]